MPHNRCITIDGTLVHDESDPWVIAEVGHNHQGELKKALELVKAAKEAGANAVKLQKRDNKNLFTKDFFNKPYDNENSYGATYGLHREALEFGLAEYKEIQAYCKELGITFFSTPFDFVSADFLRGLDVPVYKIASGDLTNLPLIKHVAGFGKPIIVSTGAATMDDVRRMHDAVMPINPNLVILQCTAAYPVEFEQMDLRVIDTYRKEFSTAVVGLSAHDNGIAMSLAAYMLGARVIEKHFTLNRAWKGTDHKFSLEPVGMRKMVRDLQRTRIALGSPEKRMFPNEKTPRQKMGKKLVAAIDLPAGKTITMADIAIKSPADGGMPPYEIELVLGRKLLKGLAADAAFSTDLLG